MQYIQSFKGSGFLGCTDWPTSSEKKQRGQMGLGQSRTPPPLAQGSRSEELDSRRQDFLDYMASMDLIGTPVEERVNGFREFQEMQFRIARNPLTRSSTRRLAETLCGLSAPPRDDSTLYDHDFDDEDATRRCEEAAYCRAARAAMVWAYQWCCE